MKHPYHYPVDYSTAFLSALDITASLAMSSLEWIPNSIQHDTNQLARDLTALENDYLRKASKA